MEKYCTKEIKVMTVIAAVMMWFCFLGEILIAVTTSYSFLVMLASIFAGLMFVVNVFAMVRTIKLLRRKTIANETDQEKQRFYNWLGDNGYRPFAGEVKYSKRNKMFDFRMDKSSDLHEFVNQDNPERVENYYFWRVGKYLKVMRVDETGLQYFVK